jgi:hypothetical protein
LTSVVELSPATVPTPEIVTFDARPTVHERTLGPTAGVAMNDANAGAAVSFPELRGSALNALMLVTDPLHDR